MMDYEVFKNVITSRIKDYLPPVYAGFDVKVQTVPKINGTKEAVILSMCTGDRALTSPNLYLDDMYMSFQKNEDVELILQAAAELVLNFTGTQMMDEHAFDVGDYKKDIVKMLINTEKNLELLESVPHREFLDLSVIYRFTVEEEDGYATALFTSDLLDEMNLTADELEILAEENTARKLRTKVLPVSDEARLVTMESVIYGAVNLMRPDELQRIAEDLKGDLFIIPMSLHELLLIRYDEAKTAGLRRTHNLANRETEEPDDFLSDNIYVYRRGAGNVEIAE